MCIEMPILPNIAYSVLLHQESHTMPHSQNAVFQLTLQKLCFFMSVDQHNSYNNRLARHTGHIYGGLYQNIIAFIFYDLCWILNKIFAITHVL